MLFDGWADIGRVLLVGPLAYLGVVVLLRASGKRTLAKMNSFDFIVTIALGSVLASILLSKDVALLEGMAALAVLIFGQFVMSFLASRSDRVQRVLKSRPELLYHRGRFLEDTLQRTRVTEEEVRAAARIAGHATLDEVDAVVLETEGTISVLTSSGTISDDIPHVMEPGRKP